MEVERGFWSQLRKPIIGLAPMDGVTDAAFRYIAAKYGHPDLMITEFTSVEGIRAGAERLLDDFIFDESERPIVAQLFGADPSAFFIAAVIVSALGFDGIDINMGCPAKNVTGHGAGAALIRDPERAKEIVRQTRAGTEAWANGISLKEAGVADNLIEKLKVTYSRKALPVSLKTRIGYDSIVAHDWVQHLLEVNPVTITLHGRTLKQLYTGFANWDVISSSAQIVHQTATIILGNGDVKDMPDARSKIIQYGVDGVLIGRATFGNPWLFQEYSPTWEERLATALEHARYLHTHFPGPAFIKVRKHLLDYVKGNEGARDLRVALMRVKTLEEIEDILVPLVGNSSAL